MQKHVCFTGLDRVEPETSMAQACQKDRTSDFPDVYEMDGPLPGKETPWKIFTIGYNIRK